MTHRISGFACGLALFAALGASAARADKIANPTAIFAGLDKITGRIINFDVATDETVQFGSLQITPRVCYTRPATEAAQTDGFIEVDEVQTDNKFKRIFSGWMYTASPGLHGVEHPVYDVWLTGCKGGSQVIPDIAALPDDQPAQSQATTLGAPAGKPANVNKTRKPASPAAPGQTDPLIAASPLDPPPRLRPNAGAQQAGAPPAQRRSPVQSFFPTAANPGDSQRERDLQR